MAARKARVSDMAGPSPRNLKWMWASAAAWPKCDFAQAPLAQVTWCHHSAVDDLRKHPDDQPTIGLLLCRSKNKLVVEYALRHLSRPVGVAAWETQLVEKLPKSFEGSLPTIEQIESELASERMRR